MRRSVALLVLFAVLVALPACSSAKPSGKTPVITKIDYDSTRDGPRMPKPEGPEKAGPKEPAECDHCWEAIPRGTHFYTDPASEVGQLALCTPVRCTKCGLVRHECAPRKRKPR